VCAVAVAAAAVALLEREREGKRQQARPGDTKEHRCWLAGCSMMHVE